MALKQLPIAGPWAGVVNNLGKPNLPLNAFDDCVNFVTIKGRIATRPKLTSFGTAPDGRPILLTKSFKDINNNCHTLVLTDTNAYAITAGPTFNLLGYPSGVANLGGVTRPYNFSIIQSRIYFSNGAPNIPVLYYDGSNALQVAGNVQGGARFMRVMNSRLILGYLNETVGGVAQDYPNRIRWSLSGDPNGWVGYSAGVADLLEVPSGIAGLELNGTNILVFRSDGISLMVPTGIGTNPFSFDHFSMQPRGVGNFYPYSLASYGNTKTIFVAEDDVYTVNGPESVPIGANMKKQIFADIGTSTTGTILGRIIPNFGPGFDYLSYWLVIPQATAAATFVYVYQFDDNTWVRQNFASSGILSALDTVYVA